MQPHGWYGRLERRFSSIGQGASLRAGSDARTLGGGELGKKADGRAPGFRGERLEELSVPSTSGIPDPPVQPGTGCRRGDLDGSAVPRMSSPGNQSLLYERGHGPARGALVERELGRHLVDGQRPVLDDGFERIALRQRDSVRAGLTRVLELVDPRESLEGSRESSGVGGQGIRRPGGGFRSLHGSTISCGPRRKSPGWAGGRTAVHGTAGH